eukprot:CAMPEP_0184861966 /NCGR_PEP_ID=MMETSP0580-20130426/6527_1 /TAXON_ID=1118495 /ORGANISM="Dactyliosolen fragilissimus" /LENGTH=2276 /DNA_ID=CAMNT_0027359649 /DNA_START=192 /DNA_END=7022 /DNA_ORIENTATION=-
MGSKAKSQDLEHQISDDKIDGDSQIEVESQDSTDLCVSSQKRSSGMSKDSHKSKRKTFRRESYGKSKNTAETMSLSETSFDSDSGCVSTRRVSSRCNKFSDSMKEPNHNSIADLLGGMTEVISSTKARSQPSPSLKRRETRSVQTTPNLKKPPKSPAICRSSRRRRVKIEINMSDNITDYSSSDESSSDTSEEEEEDMKIQRILASRSEPFEVWNDICDKMNSSEIENGSRWFQEEEEGSKGKKFEERFLVKWSDLSHIHCSWETKDDLVDQIEGAKSYLNTFFRKSHNGYLYGSDERGDGEYFDPSFMQIERILEVDSPEPRNCDYFIQSRNRKKKSTFESNWGITFDKSHPDYENGTGRQFLIKWGNLAYSECTYEFERDLILGDIEYEEQVNQYMKRKNKPRKIEMMRLLKSNEEACRQHYKTFGDKLKDTQVKLTRIEEYRNNLEHEVFNNGGQLRDYQAEGVSWMLSNYINKRSSVLADEMGLGKTIQTAAFVNALVTKLHLRGPFLIIAPLSTIPHWQREFQRWTDLNVIVYHGSAQDREMMREYEFAYDSDRPHGDVGINQSFLKKVHNKSTPKWSRTWMAQVLITTPEMLVTEDFLELAALQWELLVIDEAHRLKNHSSKLALNLRNDKFIFKSKLLLTGTPIQNNMKELWTLMNFIESKKFHDIDDFMNRYGDINSKERVDELHAEIRPFILRRLKEDVEKSVPPKEETLIEVELTVLQKQYYRALYEKNLNFLHRNVNKAVDGPSINNLAMQLRKCCNHPFLIKGVESSLQHNFVTEEEEANFIAQASGKLVLLDKLLPKLKEGGHRVLIFSQFKIMLDILEDFLTLRRFKNERIDGSITGRKRQMAIDRFQAEGNLDSSFIMLLSTRAGGVGINLTAADTCIIFDSDWNPQNDLQAQARCHRIGQTKSVKVYRLLSRKTYEMQMFHMSSLKMGLDQAVLQGIEGSLSGEEGTMTKEEVEKLLRVGAYDIFSEEKAGTSEKESNDFLEEDIESILERRSKTVIHESTGTNGKASGGTFSKASFKASKKNDIESNKYSEDVDIDDPDFWKKMIGESVEESLEDLSGKKRSRKQANYNESFHDNFLDESIAKAGMDESYHEEISFEGECDDSIEPEHIPFALLEGHEYKNKTLQEIKIKYASLKSSVERQKWGGSSPTEWVRDDVHVVMKQLLKFGYGNVSWQDFDKIIKPSLSKDYDYEEIKRMCWALCLMLFHQAILEDAEDVLRRTRRQAQKNTKAENNELSVVKRQCDKIVSSDTKLAYDKQLKASSNKMINIHNQWLSNVFSDATEFSSTKKPRSIKLVESNETYVSKTKISLTSIVHTFNENLWPLLVSRGWEVFIDGKGKNRTKHYLHQGIIYKAISDVLDIVPSIHRELSNVVMDIVSSVAFEIDSYDLESNEESLNNHTILSSKEIDVISLDNFLKRFAPMQLVFNRNAGHDSFVLHPKNINIFLYLKNAHCLMSTLKQREETQQFDKMHILNEMRKILNVNPKAALPHPCWRPIHDFILIEAITTHGWIGLESHCRAMTEDTSISWGLPFDNGKSKIRDSIKKISSPALLSEVEEALMIRESKQIQEIAGRVANFLNSEHDIIQDLKGFNLSLITKSYNLTQGKLVDSNENLQMKWRVESCSVIHKSLQNDNVNDDLNNGNNEFLELPTRKALLRRATIILSSKSEVPKPQSKLKDSTSHNFCVLDQSHPCNIFLAELLRASLKISTKSNELATKLISHALKEAKFRVHESNINNRNCDVGETMDYQQLYENIDLVGRSLPLSRQVKNILRVILGLNPIPPKNPSDPLFHTEKDISLTSLRSATKTNSLSTKVSIQDKKLNQKESATGDIAIIRALSMHDKNVAVHTDKQNDILSLTSMETLLLSVICSQGLPICTDEWESCTDDNMTKIITWKSRGSVLETAAEQWYQMSKRKLEVEMCLVTKGKESPNIEYLRKDVNAKHATYKDAQYFHKNPTMLATKTIMLVEALRLRIGVLDKNKIKHKKKTNTGLGTLVLQWNARHLLKWATELSILKDGRPMSSVSSDFISENSNMEISARLEKKSCRSIFCQIAQQTRLRSILTKCNDDSVNKLVVKAVKNLQNNGDCWERQPKWWVSNESCQDDVDLLLGLLRYGYGGFDEMLRQTSNFHYREFESNEIMKKNSTNRGEKQYPSNFTRSSVQERVNQLTRELSSMDDVSETMRIVSERKSSRLESTKLSSIADNNEVAEIKSSKGSGCLQMGIYSFFRRSPGKIATVPKSNSSMLEVNNDLNEDNSANA